MTGSAAPGNRRNDGNRWEEILHAAKPHIGTFRLVTMVESLRAKIEALGGEYRFRAKVNDLDIEVHADGTRYVRGVVLAAWEGAPGSDAQSRIAERVSALIAAAR